MRLLHLRFSPNSPPRRLASVVLLALITVSPLIQGFLPPVSHGLRELESTSDDSVVAQGSSEPWETQLERAQQMRADGRYEEAAAAYRAALGRAPNAASVALAAAEAELAAKDYRAVLDLTSLALAANPAATDAYTLRGEAFARLGDTGQALAAFNSYLAAEPVGGYVAFRAAEVAADTGDLNAAGDLYRRALDLGLSSWWEVSAARRIGRMYTVAGRPAEAVEWLERAETASAQLERRGVPVWYDGELVRRNGEAARSAVLLELGKARRDAGLIDEAVDAYSDVVALYPASTQADPALEALAELGALAAVTASARGLVHLNAGRPREAIAAFNEFRSAGGGDDRLARAAYYTGLARRNAGERGAARDDLHAMAQTYRSSALAPEALWQAARLAESIGLPASDVVRSYLIVADAFPGSDQAARSLARAGTVSLQAGDSAGARQTWGRLAAHSDAAARAQGMLLLGRNSLAVGDAAGAAASLSGAAAQAPLSYEGARARDLLARGLGAEPFHGAAPGAATTNVSADVTACADWISSWADQAGDRPAGRALGRIDRLLLVGLSGPAEAEALEAIAASTESPHALHALARGLADRQLYSQSMYAALRLGSASPAGSADQSPPCLQRLVYPLAYVQLVREQAEQRGLDPYLLLALVRQESWFDPQALSPADARGLGQVLPSTGAGIARALGRASFDAEDLYRPRENVAFGSWYLAEQIRNLGGRPLLALAAYNGGASNAQRWSGRNLRIDPDDFVDAIDFVETRGYVRSIYQMYQRYQQLYG